MSISAWHFVEGETSLGPFSTPQMDAMVQGGRVMPNTLVWNDTMPQWEPAAAHFTGFTGREPLTQTYDGLYAGAPSRDFGEAVKVCLQKWITFRGRASRSEFWFFALFSMLAGAIGSTLDLVFFGLMGHIQVFNPMVGVALFLPSFAVSVRRLHDIDRSGWWLGVLYLATAFVVIYTLMMIAGNGISRSFDPDGLLPFMGATVIAFVLYMIVLLVFYCIRGTPGPNRYG